LGPGHSDWHIYELDIPIILLSAADSEDYEFIAHAVNVSDDYGLITDLGLSASEDWGFVSGGIGGQLQLGPLRRQIDQQKFNKEGGYSKSIYKQGGSGYTSGTISVTLSGGGSPTTQAVLTPIIGSAETANGTVTTAVTGFTVANAGAGYTSTPIITITDSGSGSGAVAKARTTGTIAYPTNHFGDGQTYAAFSGVVTGGYVLQESHASTDRSGASPAETGQTPPNGGTQNYFPATWEDLGGGYTIQHFQDAKIAAYITNRNEK